MNTRPLSPSALLSASPSAAFCWSRAARSRPAGPPAPPARAAAARPARRAAAASARRSRATTELRRVRQRLRQRSHLLDGDVPLRAGLFQCSGACVALRRPALRRLQRLPERPGLQQQHLHGDVSRRDRRCARAAHASRPAATARSRTVAAATPARPARTPATTACAAARAPTDALRHPCVNTNTSNANCGGCNEPCTGATAPTASAWRRPARPARPAPAAPPARAAAAAPPAPPAAARRHRPAPRAAAAPRARPAQRHAAPAAAAARPAPAAPAAPRARPPAGGRRAAMHGCPWTGIDVLNVGTDEHANGVHEKTDSFTTPYCVSGTVGPDPGYNGVALLGFNLNETPNGMRPSVATSRPTAPRSGRPPSR